MKKKALVLAGGIPQIELIEELKRRQYFVILIDYTFCPVAEKFADKFYRESTLDVASVRSIVEHEKIDMIITCCTDQALATVSLLAEEFGLPCYIGAEIGKNVTNKQYMKKKFIDNDIPTASYKIVMDENIELGKMKFPIVVKPVDCNSSKGVKKVEDEETLRSAISAAILYSRTGTAIVEQYILGKEISVDGFVTNGIFKILCVSESEKVKDEHKFVIYKGKYPAEISLDIYNKICYIGQKIAAAFELKNSPMLIQLLVSDAELYVLEFSARTGGCIKYRMIDRACGVDVIKKTVDLFENKNVVIEPVRKNRYIVDEFVYCKNGVFDHVEGLDFCLEKGWIKEFYILKTSGEQFSGVNSSGDRIAAMVYDNDSYEEYRCCHNNVIQNISVKDVDGTDIMRHDLLPYIS